MWKEASRRAASLLMTLVLILGLLPAVTVPVSAVTAEPVPGLLDSDLKLTTDSRSAWTAYGMGVTGTATGNTSDSGCSSLKNSTTTTLTIQNQSGKRGTLAFTSSLENGGSVSYSLDGQSIPPDENSGVSLLLAPDQRLTVTLESKAGEGNTTTLKLSNVRFLTEKTFTVTFEASSAGSYTVNGIDVLQDKTESNLAETGYVVSAKEQEGVQFLGWYFGNQLISADANTTLYPYDDHTTVRAQFNVQSDALFGVGGSAYSDLQTAVSMAQATQINQVNVLKDAVITSDCTIPSGVTLVVPYREGNQAPTASNNSESPYALADWVTGNNLNLAAAETNVYRTLTVAKGATLTVSGVVVTGGTIASAAGVAGCTSASATHSNLQVDGSLVIDNGGVLSSCGYVTGSGTTTVKSGGCVYQPFVVMDFCGGGYTVTASAGATSKPSYGIKPQSGEAAVSPFQRWAMPNIQCTITYEYGSALYGYADLYANSSHNKTTAQILGTNNGLLQIDSPDTTVTCTYDGDTAVSTRNGTQNTSLANLGKTTVTINGNASFGNMKLVMSIQAVIITITADIDTAKLTFPIPYHYDFVIQNGTFTVKNNVALYPGVSVTVADEGILAVPKNVSLTIYPALYDQKRTGSSEYIVSQTAYATHGQYPTTSDLQTAGLSGSANLIVNGTMKLDGNLGGLVQTGGTGTIQIGTNAGLSTVTQVGSIGTGSAIKTYYNAGATVHTIPAQVYDPVLKALVNLTSGTTYAGKETESYALPEYTYRVYTNPGDTNVYFDKATK